MARFEVYSRESVLDRIRPETRLEVDVPNYFESRGKKPSQAQEARVAAPTLEELTSTVYPDFLSASVALDAYRDENKNNNIQGWKFTDVRGGVMVELTFKS